MQVISTEGWIGTQTAENLAFGISGIELLDILADRDTLKCQKGRVAAEFKCQRSHLGGLNRNCSSVQRGAVRPVEPDHSPSPM
jgi:hypothetical protein